ncbi:chemotaxis protein CheW [bacterium]|nr:chemotaxis protein CheW [bacterium]
MTIGQGFFMDQNELQLVSFCLGNEIFAIDIMMIKEIIRIKEIVPVPQAPDVIEGVINLRGKVIPVFCMRKKFKMPPKERGTKDRIIVCEFDKTSLGLIVDEVQQVLRVPVSQLDNVSAIVSSTVGENFIKGIIKKGDKLIVLLKPKELLSKEEKELLFKGVLN